MSTKKYRSPNITINKIYTKTGDSGFTSLVGGQKLSKADLRISSYGEIDELIALIGGCREKILTIDNDKIKVLGNVLKRIQNELFNVGNMIATIDHNSNMPKVENNHVEMLEQEIDRYNNNLPTLKSFVLPGGTEINIWLHLARTVCRRCERKVVKLSNKENINSIIIKYLNRLSDALFTWSRWINYKLSIKENIWNPNEE